MRKGQGVRRSVSGARVACLAVAFVLAFNACSSSGRPAGSTSPTTASTPTSAPASGSATITSFEVPASVQCASAPSTTVRITYAVRGAKTVEIAVDGLAEPTLTASSGTVTERVHCDGVAHTIALAAVDAQARRTSQVKYLNTLLANG